MQYKYSFSTDDACIMEISDTMAEVLRREDAAIKNCSRRYADHNRQSFDRNCEAGIGYASDADTVAAVIARDDRNALRRAIPQLSPGQQSIIYDLYWRQLSGADIARRDGISRAAVSQRHAAAIAALRRIMGITP